MPHAASSRSGLRVLGLLVAVLLGAATRPAAAAPEDYAIDPVHTRIVFIVGHAGFSHAMGAISGSSGTLRFDRDDWRSAQLDVTVPVTRLDLGDAKWNDAVLASNLLDGKRYPQAHFVSREVEDADAEHARVCGDLTLRGTTAPVCMDVTFNALKRHPLPPFRRTVGFSATATLSRKAFGITTWPTVIGDEVKLLIEAEAVRSRGKEETEAPEPTPAEAATPDPRAPGTEAPDANETQPESEPDPVPPASH